MNTLYKIYSFISKFILSICHVSSGKCALVRLPFYIKGGRRISIGDGCFIGKGAKLYSYGSGDKGQIIIGNNFCAQTNLMISSIDKVTIGNHVLLGSNVMINDNDHLVSPEEGPYSVVADSITIGDKTWIAQNVCILKGVHIGKACVVGAGSIVTRDIPDYHMAAGNPARIIKKWDFEKNKWVKVTD